MGCLAGGRKRDCPKKTPYYEDTIKMHNILEDARVSIGKRDANLLSPDTINSINNIMTFYSIKVPYRGHESIP
jgi:hypothetical protein